VGTARKNNTKKRKLSEEPGEKREKISGREKCAGGGRVRENSQSTRLNILGNLRDKNRDTDWET